MREFFTAAQENEVEVDPEDVVTFKHDDREVTFYKPTAAQFAILSSASVNSSEFEAAGTYLALFFEMAEEDTARYFRSRLFDRNDPFDIDSEGGIQDIMMALIEEWSARPTKQPSDYQPPRSTTGKSSTATSSAKASTSSSTRRRASSR